MKTKTIKKSILGLFLLFGESKAQDFFSFSGKISNQSNYPVSKAKVFIQGQRDTVFSDASGNFKIPCPQGTHIFFCIANKYQLLTDTISVQGDTSKFLVLEEEVKSMGEARITVRKRSENTVEGILKSKQATVNVMDVISSEDFAKTTIRTSSDAIKRIPGATIMEGRFANIRGMFDRYNLGILNGSPLPSTESDRKAFSFDVVPSVLLDNIKIIKSGTPEVPGDFGGGVIYLNTRNTSNKFSQSFSIGFQTNSITSFSSHKSFKMQGTEIIGIPGSHSSIPDLDPQFGPATTDPYLRSKETQKFNNDWSSPPIFSLPTPRFSYTLGIPKKIRRKEIGFLFNVNHSSTQKYSDGKIETRDYSANYIYKSFSDKILNTNIQNGGLMNLSIKLNSKNRVEFKNLFSSIYDVGSIFRSGISDRDNNMFVDGYSSQIGYNRLFSSQLIGSHSLNKEKETHIQWILNLGNIKRSVPDFRIAQYSIQDEDKTTRVLILNDFFNSGSGRFFSNLKESNFSFSGDFSRKILTSINSISSSIKTGIYFQKRERDFWSRNFVYGPIGVNIFSQSGPEMDLNSEGLIKNGLYLKEKTGKDKDEYNGTSSLYAGYIQLENRIPIIKRNAKTYHLKIIYGLRIERFGQILQNEYFSSLGKSRGTNLYMSNNGFKTDWLPSINFNLPLSQKSSLRGSYFKSINRPEFRELAPFAFYNFSINSEILGNPDLKRSLIQNYDLRYEIYPGKEGLISIGVFRKKILNPIEFSLDVTQSLIRTFYYRNEKSALNKGVEIEIRKNLDFFGPLLGSRRAKNFTFYGNFALIHSEIKFLPGSQSTQNRPLQGQSPYIINLSLFYQNPKGWQVNTNFNKIGQRIAYIGSSREAQPFGHDIVEFGRSILDLQVSKEIGKGSIKITFGDILSQKTVFYQDLNQNKKYDSDPYEKGGDNTLFSFTNGKTLTLSYLLNF